MSTEKNLATPAHYTGFRRLKNLYAHGSEDTITLYTIIYYYVMRTGRGCGYTQQTVCVPLK